MAREFIFPTDCDTLEESISQLIPEQKEVINTILSGGGLMNPFQNEFSMFDTDASNALERLGSVGQLLQASGQPALANQVNSLYSSVQDLQGNIMNYKTHVDRISGVGVENLQEFGQRFAIAKSYSHIKQQMEGSLGGGFTDIYGSLQKNAGEMFSGVSSQLTSITSDILPEGVGLGQLTSGGFDLAGKLTSATNVLNEHASNVTSFINSDDSAFAEALNYVSNHSSAIGIMNSMQDEDDCFSNYLFNDMLATSSLKGAVNNMQDALGKQSGQGISEIIDQLSGL
tara:strand:- start:103 stop:957 length:855 start_codon:yes stop_codon:yes gene_type:complete